MKTLLDTLAAWKPFRALVVGDFMLDQLVYGNADRLTPEAPVPVLHVQREEDRPGGAANVCLDLAAMHAKVETFGVTGTDAAGQTLRRLLGEAGIESRGIIQDPTRPTTIKRSLIGMAQHRHPQRMFRMDYESMEPLAKAASKALVSAFESALSGASVVCIEDYNKGVCSAWVCQEVIRLARAAGVPVLVDPAAIADYSKYRGATTITPNRAEAALASGLRIAPDASPLEHTAIAEKLLAELALDTVVVTLDRHGALLMERAHERESPHKDEEHAGHNGLAPGGAGGLRATAVPTVARQVYDVTGAGDMVLAALAGALAHKMSWLDAVKLANVAAGLEVAVFGVVPIPIEAIHREVIARERETSAGGSHAKTRTLEELLIDVAALKRDGKKIVFTNGCFDVLHVGHLSILRRAAAQGDFLVVATNCDATVRSLKGPGRPVNTESDRAELLGGLSCVGAVIVFAEETPERIIRAIQPDVLVKGAEYSVAQVPGAEFVIASGGRVELLDMVLGKSTTRTVERIRGTA
ncbi:MAG: bifunctional heptose 7-phosphate kinase/heptose 1-phosphate adenyltransferase [Pyrinomonadaceae bacterium]|nr:bifunctional heptose 7-phosphate kinase/heptose 1-phosphate adenyltransferase [Phycisphaerales bacterium]